ncbi:MAG: hypothetical protein WKG01_21875 [Kofleriaceae bacterium]
MKWLLVSLFVLLAACAMVDTTPDAPHDPTRPAYRPQQASASAVDEQCVGSPPTNVGAFRHRRNRMYAALGEPSHRGIDLIASHGDATQTIAGKLAYTAADKDLSDEYVTLFACVDHRWSPLGRATTDGDGRFALTLTGPRRLPVGMRDLLAQVPGDGREMRFLAYVSAPNEHVVVTDIDGTLTQSENAIVGAVLAGKQIEHRWNAPAALQRSRRPIVYVTARGDQLTESTRGWLREHGFPRGPMRLAPQLLVPPGPAQRDFKTMTLRALGVPIVAGIGNRATDILCYRDIGLAPERIFIHLTELEPEVRQEIAAGRARGFRDYRDLASLLP